jgi:hypothetical protein
MMTTILSLVGRRDARSTTTRRRGFQPSLQNLEGRQLLTTISGSPIGTSTMTTVVSTSPSTR